MRKLLIGTIILLMLVPSVGSISVNKTSQSNYGNIFYVGGSGAGNYTRIQDAIDNASDGDTVFVFKDSSPYKENIHIPKSLQIVGENRTTTVILSNNKSNAVNITGLDVIFKGFTIQTVEDTFNYLKLNANNIQIVNNRFVNITIRSEKSNNISIMNNIFQNGKWSKRIIIYLRSGNNCLIKSNIISESNSGIRLYKCQDSNICFNTVHNCFTGIAVVKGNLNVIYKNLVDIANYGIYLNGARVLVKNNKVFNSNSGIVLYHTTHANISNNAIKENMFSIEMDGAVFTKILSNNFEFNIGNTFVFNSFFTRWNHNYWGRPKLLPKIIIVGIEILETTFESIIIPYLNFDWRPAILPNDIGE